MNALNWLIHFFLHVDLYVGQIIATYGILTYAILFVVIFIETGLVFTPFLPGDSLLFAAGAFAALGSLNIVALWLLLCLAAVLGDTANYWIGHFFGEKFIENPRIPIQRKHVEETQKFFQKYGGKTIVLARFVPIVRTFAPFVAGIGKMAYGRFLSFNVIGGVGWVTIGTLAGYFFGNIQVVKNHFSLLILAIVLISVLPMLIPLLKKLIASVFAD